MRAFTLNRRLILFGLTQKFICEWKIKLKENSKLDLYDQIKHVFGKEKYLDDLTSFQMRKSISKFRCSDHRLEIEVGRHKKTKREERYCTFCPNEIENESHFLSKCPSYKSLRLNLFNKETIDTHFEKDILACKDKSLTVKLGLYLDKALKKRDIFIDALKEHERMLKHLIENGYTIID